jgi:hypothetical protein
VKRTRHQNAVWRNGSTLRSANNVGSADATCSVDPTNLGLPCPTPSRNGRPRTCCQQGVVHGPTVVECIENRRNPNSPANGRYRPGCAADGGVGSVFRGPVVRLALAIGGAWSGLRARPLVGSPRACMAWRHLSPPTLPRNPDPPYPLAPQTCSSVDMLISLLCAHEHEGRARPP